MTLCALEVFDTPVATRSGAIRRRGDDEPDMRNELAVVMIATTGPANYFVIGLRGPDADAFWKAFQMVPLPHVGRAQVEVAPFSGDTFVVFEAAVKRARDAVTNWIAKNVPAHYTGDAQFVGRTPEYRAPLPAVKPYETTDDEFKRRRAQAQNPTTYPPKKNTDF